ncbi:MAG: hypothetical protein AB7O92_28250 [Acidimicrobiia bacterium]
MAAGQRAAEQQAAGQRAAGQHVAGQRSAATTMLDGVAGRWEQLGQTVGVREADLVQLHLAGTDRSDGLPALVAVADDRCPRLIVHVDRLAEHVRVGEIEAIARRHGCRTRNDGHQVVIGVVDAGTVDALLAAVLERHATSPQLISGDWLVAPHARSARVEVHAFTVFWPAPDAYEVGAGASNPCLLATAIYGWHGTIAFLDGGCWVSRRAGRAAWVVLSTRRFGPVAFGCDARDRVLFAPTRSLPSGSGSLLSRLQQHGRPLPTVEGWPDAEAVLAEQLPAAGYLPRHVHVEGAGR